MKLDEQGMVNMLRRVRHDFANHLQVIYGYLELDMPEKVISYINGLVDEMAEERVIFETLKAEEALYFYSQLLLAREIGIIIKYEDLNVNSVGILKTKNEPYKSLLSYSNSFDNNDDYTIVYLTVYEDNKGIVMLFTCDIWEQETKRVRIDRE